MSILRRSVYNFAQQLKERKEPVRVLLNNGGDFSPPDNPTEDGFEVCFVLACLYFLPSTEIDNGCTCVLAGCTIRWTLCMQPC